MVTDISSLADYDRWQNMPGIQHVVYDSARLADWARLWGLARCGHHPFCDGRSARHLGSSTTVCSRGVASYTLVHALTACSFTADLRLQWAARVGLASMSPQMISDACASDWIWVPSHRLNTRVTVAAHVFFVGRVCLMAPSRQRNFHLIILSV